MAEKHIVPFPTMETAIDSIRLFAKQNDLTPCELIDTLLEGCVAKQMADASFGIEPIAIVKGISDSPYSGPLYWWMPATANQQES